MRFRFASALVTVVSLAAVSPALADPLHDAAKAGDADRVGRLIEQGADVDSKNYRLGLTPLHLAAAEGHTAVVERLIASGAEVDARIRNGFTPLFEAARKGHLAVVDLLIQKGADVDAIGGRGPLHSWTPLIMAIHGDRIEVVELLLAKGADIDVDLLELDLLAVQRPLFFPELVFFKLGKLPQAQL